MNFTKDDRQAVDYTQLQEGSVANATFTSFNYYKGLCFGTFEADGQTVRAIIGDADNYPLKELLPLKGIEVQVRFNGTKVSNGSTYPRYTIEF